jgi:hypothetical protein
LKTKKFNHFFFNMDFFNIFIKNGEIFKDYFWGFWCGIMDIHNIKKCSWCLKNLRKNIYSNLHKFIINLYMKKYNLKVYMHPYMHEHFDVITNIFKYKYETCQVFIHPFKKLWWVQNVTCGGFKLVMDLTYQLEVRVHYIKQATHFGEWFTFHCNFKFQTSK